MSLGTVKIPTLVQLGEVATEHGLSFSEADLAAHLEALRPSFEGYNLLDQMPDIAEQEDGGKPAQVCVRDGQGTVLARFDSRHDHGVGVDSRGDIYAGLTTERSVDKFVRKG